MSTAFNLLQGAAIQAGSAERLPFGTHSGGGRVEDTLPLVAELDFGSDACRKDEE